MRTRKPKEQPHPYYVGQPVAITQPDTFKGVKLAVVISKCKYNDGGVICSLVNPGDLGFREVCIKEDKGDTIVSVAAKS